LYVVLLGSFRRLVQFGNQNVKLSLHSCDVESF
jgi:hypothetical protein